MPFSAAELDNLANSLLDHFVGKGELYAQAIQQKPLMRALDANAKTFPGGKEFISIGVKTGKGGLNLTGYTHDDTVAYGNPTPAQRVNYKWREHHIGMGLTHTELKHGGITVNESDGGESMSNKSDREAMILAEVYEEKASAMNEDYAISWDTLLHGDGTGDAKAISGIRAFILADPALGSTGGLARTNTWWRNRAATAAAAAAGSGEGAISSTPANGGALLQFLQRERRQLTRFAPGKVNHFAIAGSDFINAMEIELRANGNYANDGFRNRGNVNGALPTDNGVPFGSWNFVYDPTLDDLGFAKRAYIIDLEAIKIYYMAGEKMKKAKPKRPHDKYVLYRGVTTTAGLAARRLNTSGVYDIA